MRCTCTLTSVTLLAFARIMTAVLKSVGMLAVVAVLASCAPQLNQYNADRYYDLGLEKEFSGDYAGAREAFRRALINAKSGKAQPSYVSAVLYNLGRMHGYTCDFESSDRLIVESLFAERALESPDPANITKRLSELARLSFDRQYFEQSTKYYSEVIPMLEKLGVLEDDPVGYAYFLEGYSNALERLGSTGAASEVYDRAKSLRTDNSGITAKFIPLEYRDVCSGSAAL